ncbi:CpaB family protein [Anaerovorax odorimutans]|uniref:hypothetical protein n=1 Tax=Anaerovorax odorimutans TaxID=109327 RepID=UPI00041F02F2|nr:hypothetical protein [Anaerovorax odorimutans]
MINFNKMKLFIGLLLIVIAIGGLTFWELKGRNLLFMETVVVANQDITAGTKITKDLLSQTEILKENKVKGAIKPEEINEKYGKAINQNILKSDQISAEYFNNDDFCIKKGQSIFVINRDWIAMRSSSLRRGDIVNIYLSNNEGLKLGTYKLAYVKDDSDREIKSVNEMTGVRVNNNDLLDREDSSGSIDHIEIICSIDQYDVIKKMVESQLEPSLIIVQKEDYK